MYAFVHIEKTAGTTMTSILRRSFGIGHCDIRLPLAKRGSVNSDQRNLVSAADLRRVKRIYRNLRGISGHDVKTYSDLELECRDIRYFTFLRDPRRRFLSHFLTRANSHRPEELDRWLAASWIHNWQTKMICGEPNAQKAIDVLSTKIGFTGLTERFDESLLLLGQWIQEPAFRPEYRRKNDRTQTRGYQNALRHQTDTSYLDSEDVSARIDAANAEDQKVYDYVISTIYPRQQAEYRGDLAADLMEFQRNNNGVGLLKESRTSSFVRNYVYKPLIHLRAA